MILGSVAPDTLEFSRYDETHYFKRSSLVPHRTYTHWTLLWCILLIVSIIVLQFTYWGYVFLAYCIGGLWHLVGDLPNPSGIPVWHPRKRRKSLKWWKSGQYETSIFFMMLITTLFVMCLMNQDSVSYHFTQFMQNPFSVLKAFFDNLVERCFSEFCNLIRNHNYDFIRDISYFIFILHTHIPIMPYCVACVVHTLMNIHKYKFIFIKK
ncbi:metal-dependent hydrolase [Lonepinella sp. BR2271]|uniref:metal-dependent hydrolase n=1 Tax=Lonepinella sp. BR2271 TaxID=3434550 RepID=UPI003F6E2C41